MNLQDFSSSNESNFIELNCLGRIFHIRETSLNRFPKSLLGSIRLFSCFSIEDFHRCLGDRIRRSKFFNREKNQFIIDRHIGSFEAIIHYYETGKLVAPLICEPIIFYDELKYFRFDSEVLENFYDNEIKDESIYQIRLVPSNRILKWIWIALEYEDYSIYTKLIQLFLLIISLIYCFNICIELIPQLSREKMICHKFIIDQHRSRCENIFFDFRPSKIRQPWIKIIEQMCTIFITFECVLRCFTSPHKWKTLTLLMNIFDFLILLSSYFYLFFMMKIQFDNDQQDPFFYMKLFQYLFLFRLLRFLRLCRFVKSLRILFRGIENAIQDILTLGFVMIFFVFTFGVIIGIVEKNTNRFDQTRLEDLFNIVTISTITVGDAKRVPLTSIGKILCSFLAGFGLIAISLPLPSIYRIFQSIYRQEHSDKRSHIVKYISNDLLSKNNGRVDFNET